MDALNKAGLQHISDGQANGGRYDMSDNLTLSLSEAMYAAWRRVAEELGPSAEPNYVLERVTDTLIDLAEERVRVAIEKATTEAIEENNDQSAKAEIDDDRVWWHGYGHGERDGIERLASMLGVDYDEPRLNMPYLHRDKDARRS